MLTPYPPPSLLLLTSTTGLMIASQTRGGRWMCWQRRWRRTLGWTCRSALFAKNMRNRSRAEVEMEGDLPVRMEVEVDALMAVESKFRIGHFPPGPKN